MKKYNLDPLKEQCANNKVFFNEMLDIFISSSLEGIANMDEAYAKKDLVALGHYAHKIISPCKHIEADEICVLLKEIELKAEENKLTPERAEVLIQKIKLETLQLIEEIKTEYM